MIVVSQASINDIPKIVELLKLSLGESVVEKSSTIWNFKHVDNPFGHSLPSKAALAASEISC